MTSFHSLTQLREVLYSLFTKSATMPCKICFESKAESETFVNRNCLHSFCTHCLSEYISSKIKEKVSAVECPEEGCKEMIEPEDCQGFLPKTVFDGWGKALCEAMILASGNFTYCPYKDCSDLLSTDEWEECEDGEVRCPSCRRMFCAKCRVPWHSGMSCRSFKERDDLKLIELAKEKKWMKCPSCKFFVERTSGCPHITCRCKCEFCYGCGERYTDSHGGCAAD